MEHVEGMGELRNAYKILVGKFEVMRSFVILRHRWRDDIRVDLTKQVEKVRTGFICFRTGSSGGLL
jgi:hypothetical protein